MTMLSIRRASERGHAQHGWLDSHHTFSFADYYDPKHMGFRALRVINEDKVEAGRGFGAHPHRDMEILSYVLEGELEHRDSMGNGSTIRPGDVQRMSAGRGVTHSEANPSKTNRVHFLQIWIVPEANGIEPSYEQKHFSNDDKRGRLRLVASKDGRDGSVRIHQDADLYAAVLDRGESLTYETKPGRHTWIHLAKGGATIGGQPLRAGDAASTSDAGPLLIEGDGAELLVFDLG